MRRRGFLRSCAAAGLAFPSWPALGQDANRSAPAWLKIEKLVPKVLAETKTPGASLALVRDGRLQWQGVFGVRDSESKLPVEGESGFEAASVSKTVFAYAVLKLCEKGILDLDVPLSNYARQPFLKGDARLDLITARQALSHTSGFQDWRSGAEPLKIHFQPGEKFLYSGEAYFYLQSVVNDLLGTTDRNDCAQFEGGLEVCASGFEDFMKRTVLDPFGMTSSRYTLNPKSAPIAARPHDANTKPMARSSPSAPATARYGAAGGLITTATDYAKFLVEILAPKRADAFRLSARSLREMVRPQIKLDDATKIDGASAWALGWAVRERPDGNFLVHSGGQSGFRALAVASLEKKSGFIILTNGDNGGRVVYHPLLEEALNEALGW